MNGKLTLIHFALHFLIKTNVWFKHGIPFLTYCEDFQQDGDYVFQQDGALPHWALDVRAFLNQQLQGRWIGRAAERDLKMMKWPPRSPDLIPLDFYFLGYAKGKVYFTPQPQMIDELKVRIRAAFQTVTIDII